MSYLELGGKRFTVPVGEVRIGSDPSGQVVLQGDKIAPRLGASLDLTGDGRAKIFGSWGRYYDWTKYELSRNALGSDFWRIYYRALDTLDVSSLSLSNMPGRDLWIVPGSFPTVSPLL